MYPGPRFQCCARFSGTVLCVVAALVSSSLILNAIGPSDQAEMYQPSGDEIERFKLLQEQIQMETLQQQFQEQIQQHQAQQQQAQQIQAQQMHNELQSHQSAAAAAALVPLILAATGNGPNTAGSDLVQLHPSHHQQHLQQLFQQPQPQTPLVGAATQSQPSEPVNRHHQPQNMAPMAHQPQNPGFDLLMLSQAAGIANIQAVEEQQRQHQQQKQQQPQQTPGSNKKQDLNYGQHYGGEHHVSENHQTDVAPTSSGEYEEDKYIQGEYHTRGSIRPPYRCYACAWTIQHCADFNCYNNPDICTNNHFSPRRIQRADCPTGCEQFVVTDPNGLVQQWQRGCAPINHIPVKGYQCRTHYQFGIRFDRCICNQDWCNSAPTNFTNWLPLVTLLAFILCYLS